MNRRNVLLAGIFIFVGLLFIPASFSQTRMCQAKFLPHLKLKGRSNRHFDSGKTCFNEEAVGKFLTELYWLKRSVKESELFDDIEFLFIEIWPNAK
jgi:hypothetical protein